MGVISRNLQSSWDEGTAPACVCVQAGWWRGGWEAGGASGWMGSPWCSSISRLERYVRGMAGMRGLAGAGGGPAGACSSPPTAAIGSVLSPERVTNLPLPVSLQPLGLPSCWEPEEFCRGTVRLCNSAEIKTSTPLSAPVGWGREGSAQTFLFTPQIFLWVLCRISPGCTRWAVREITDNALA